MANKRMTWKRADGTWGLVGSAWNEISAKEQIVTYGALCKLKDYEDTGLSPQEVADLMADRHYSEPQRVINRHHSNSEKDIEAFGKNALFGFCPICMALNSDLWNHKYCGDCGQELDWSEDE